MGNLRTPRICAFRQAPLHFYFIFFTNSSSIARRTLYRELSCQCHWQWVLPSSQVGASLRAPLAHASKTLLIGLFQSLSMSPKSRHHRQAFTRVRPNLKVTSSHPLAPFLPASPPVSMQARPWYSFGKNRNRAWHKLFRQTYRFLYAIHQP
jgi:hypothetical protein